MFEAGVEEEVRAALARPISPTARKTLGLDEVATLPREEAIEAIVVRTRRYAAYQRKWMRRIPASLWSMRIARRARSPMTSSRWQAHGNVYLVAETTSTRWAGLDGVMRCERVDGDDVWSRSSTPTARSPRCPATGRGSPPPG